MKKIIKLTESDLHKIIKESVKKIIEGFGKGDSYSFYGDGTKDCQFLTKDGYSVGLVNHNKKEVRPCHGYYYPNKCAKSLMKYALRIGYTYVDSEMPPEKNKTLNLIKPL